MQTTQRKMKVCLKNGIYTSRGSSGIGYVDQTNSRIRLRGGRDHIWMSPSLDSNITNISSVHNKSHEKFNTPLTEFIENARNIKKVKDKHSLNQPVKIGIRNIKQIQHIPTKFQKVVMPRNNIRLSYPILKNMYINTTIDSSSTMIMKRRANIKKILNDSQKKKFQSKFMQELSNKQNTLTKTTLKNISKFSVLLLYLHFLFCYYLSFTKTQQFIEFFEICTTDTI